MRRSEGTGLGSEQPTARLKAAAGAAIEARGLNNHGVAATTNTTNRAAVLAVNRRSARPSAGLVASGFAGVVGIAARPRGFGLLSSGNLGVEGNVRVNGNVFVTGSVVTESSSATGTTVLDAAGAARVQPESTAGDSEYDHQLTAIGAAMPNLHVVEDAHGGFTIKGGNPGGRVSWQRIKRTDAALLGQSLSDMQLPDLSAYVDQAHPSADSLDS